MMNDYPDNWNEIADRIKAGAGNRCERCHHPHDPANGYTLTVHHLDGNKANCEDWNLAALCQRCHLHIQAKVKIYQIWMFEHSDWMIPHVRGMEEAHPWLPTYPPPLLSGDQPTRAGISG